MESHNLIKIEVSKNREIHVQVNDFRGHVGLDIRTYIETANYVGYTPKGIRIPPECAEKVAEAIMTVITRYKRESGDVAKNG